MTAKMWEKHFWIFCFQKLLIIAITDNTSDCLIQSRLMLSLIHIFFPVIQNTQLDVVSTLPALDVNVPVVAVVFTLVEEIVIPVSYTHLDVYKRQVGTLTSLRVATTTSGALSSSRSVTS